MATLPATTIDITPQSEPTIVPPAIVQGARYALVQPGDEDIGVESQLAFVGGEPVIIGDQTGFVKDEDTNVSTSN